MCLLCTTLTLSDLVPTICTDCSTRKWEQFPHFPLLVSGQHNRKNYACERSRTWPPLESLGLGVPFHSTVEKYYSYSTTSSNDDTRRTTCSKVGWEWSKQMFWVASLLPIQSSTHTTHRSRSHMLEYINSREISPHGFTLKISICQDNCGITFLLAAWPTSIFCCVG